MRAPEWIRTTDTGFRRAVLYPLSYEGAPVQCTGFAPVLSHRGPRVPACQTGSMTLLIDPPLWPAHGTCFSHLVSESSLVELHGAAERIGLSPRAFDRDHYDVPEHLHRAAVEAGALAVSAGELTRRLRASGLRVPARERPRRIRRRLLSAWERTLPGRPGLGEALLADWDGEGRHYHTSVHLAEVLERIEELDAGSARPAGEARPLRIAAWYHDVVYEGVPGRDERLSAERAAADLAGVLPQEELERIRRLILATADHSAASEERLWPVFHDADLGILAAPPDRYRRYSESVRLEYAHVPEEAFRSGRARILRGLLREGGLYLTETARRGWEPAARRNLEAEIAALEDAR
jgi:predicted metal-dependent HD superfamily phosphohydrolase